MPAFFTGDSAPGLLLIFIRNADPCLGAAQHRNAYKTPHIELVAGHHCDLAVVRLPVLGIVDSALLPLILAVEDKTFKQLESHQRIFFPCVVRIVLIDLWLAFFVERRFQPADLAEILVALLIDSNGGLLRSGKPGTENVIGRKCLPRGACN